MSSKIPPADPAPSGPAAARPASGSRRLDLCLIAPPSLRVPPIDYGGTQRGLADLCRGLGRMGHRVTLCAPASSKAEVDELFAPIPAALWEASSPVPLDERAWQAERYVEAILGLCARRRFDLINVRYDHRGLLESLVESRPAPVLYSLHNPNGAFFDGFFTRLVSEAVRRTLATSAHCRFHRLQFAHVPGMHVIPYGLDVAASPWSPEPLSRAVWEPTLPVLRRLREQGRDYLLAIGRISPAKAQAEAIAVARMAGLPLILAGEPELRDGEGRRYFEEHVAPRIDGEQVIAVGRTSEPMRQELYRGARAVLFLSGLGYQGHAESFGRPLMEALAAGTPVVAYAAGAALEVLDDRVAVLGRSRDELARGIAHAAAIDRTGCRRFAAERFGLERFAGDHERLFVWLIERWRNGERLDAPETA